VTKPKIPKPEFKHLTAFAQMNKPRGTKLDAFILCGKRITVKVQYTNDPDGDHNCPDCKRCLDTGTTSGRLTRKQHPMLRDKQALYYF
jgi:hypothetical protein